MWPNLACLEEENKSKKVQITPIAITKSRFRFAIHLNGNLFNYFSPLVNFDGIAELDWTDNVSPRSNLCSFTSTRAIRDGIFHFCLRSVCNLNHLWLFRLCSSHAKKKKSPASPCKLPPILSAASETQRVHLTRNPLRCAAITITIGRARAISFAKKNKKIDEIHLADRTRVGNFFVAYYNIIINARVAQARFTPNNVVESSILWVDIE